MDRLASHINPKVLSMMMRSRLRSMFIPTNSSHFIQPLDNLCFAKWKNAFQKVLTSLDLHPNNNSKPSVGLEAVVMSIESLAFDRRTIIKSFKNTGICSIDWDKIKINAEKAKKQKFSKGNQDQVEALKRHECM